MGNLSTSVWKKMVPFSTSTRTCFLDVVSINQANEHQMEQGIYSIGGRWMLKKSGHRWVKWVSEKGLVISPSCLKGFHHFHPTFQFYFLGMPILDEAIWCPFDSFSVDFPEPQLVYHPDTKLFLPIQRCYSATAIWFCYILFPFLEDTIPPKFRQSTCFDYPTSIVHHRGSQNEQIQLLSP